jgi:alpha-tubulin suppressor-like RCC1 family protein
MRSLARLTPAAAAAATALFAPHELSRCAQPPAVTRREALAWGAGGFGQTGLGAERDVATPTPLDVGRDLRERAAAVVSSGPATSSGLLTEDGRAYTWGCGRDGRLGHGVAGVTNQDAPRLVEGLPEPVSQLALGEYFGLAVGAGSGRVYSWGRRATGRHAGVKAPPAVAPVEGLHGVRVVAVAAGREHAVAVDAEGGVWSWGVGSSYALGHGDKADVPTPRRVAAMEGAWEGLRSSSWEVPTEDRRAAARTAGVW